MVDFKAGDRVRIKGDLFDMTDHMDGEVVKVKRIRGNGDVVVRVGSCVNDVWIISAKNILEVVSDG